MGIGAQDLSDEKQQYEVTQQINSIRALVEEWRQAPESQWKVSAETARLLKHWRHHEFKGIRPFYCQIEAAETCALLIKTWCQSSGVTIVEARLDRQEATQPRPWVMP
jgi:hypothetical protein